MSTLFHQITDATIILRRAGIYYQRGVYWRKGFLYTTWTNGYVRLVSKGRTALPTLFWEDLVGVEVVIGDHEYLLEKE